MRTGPCSERKRKEDAFVTVLAGQIYFRRAGVRLVARYINAAVLSELVVSAAATKYISNFSRIAADQRGYTALGFTNNGAPRGSRWVTISTGVPDRHLSGFVMRPTPVKKRAQEGVDAVTGFYVDKGIFTSWRFHGTRGSDQLTFGPQGHIISKRRGGIVNFGRDNVRDVFTFTNQIDVARCSEKHGFQCSPLNHLSKVVITNFGRQDVINLQGKQFGWQDVGPNGTLPGVESSRLIVQLQPGLG